MERNLTKRSLTTDEGTEVLIEYKKVPNPIVKINGVPLPQTYSRKLVITVEGVQVVVGEDFGGYCDDLWMSGEIHDKDGNVTYFTTEGNSDL